jgi:hypothetical protein
MNSFASLQFETISGRLSATTLAADYLSTTNPLHPKAYRPQPPLQLRRPHPHARGAGPQHPQPP